MKMKDRKKKIFFEVSELFACKSKSVVLASEQSTFPTDSSAYCFSIVSELKRGSHSVTRNLFFFYYFQRSWSWYPCSQVLSICFYWFYYSMLFKDCWILDTELRLCLTYLNTHSFKKSEMYSEGHDETLGILLGILVIFPFQWVIFASWTLCSLETLNLLAKPLQTLSLHFQVQNISLLF